MANYVNLTLDTVGPRGVSIQLNNGESVTTVNAINYVISCEDEDLTGYQMKMWGTAACPTEEQATWQTLIDSDIFLVSSQEGLKTIYVKLRDDVWNESATASATITLSTKIPSLTNLSLSKSKVSLVSGKNTTGGSFTFDENIDAVKIMIVQNINAKHDDSGNISIPTTNGSRITSEDENILSGNYMEFTDNVYDSIFAAYYNINAADIAAVSPGDGIKIIKVFIRSATSKNWSA